MLLAEHQKNKKRKKKVAVKKGQREWSVEYWKILWHCGRFIGRAVDITQSSEPTYNDKIAGNRLPKTY